MKKIKRQFRQGDVLLVPVDTIPASAKAVTGKKRVVLAEGEASGHAHTIDYAHEEMRVFTDGEQLYLRVKLPVVLQHQEHGPIAVDPGDYLVKRQTEIWLDEVRQVAD